MGIYLFLILYCIYYLNKLHTILSNNIFYLDTLYLNTTNKRNLSLDNVKFLAQVMIITPSNSSISNSIIGVNLNNYNGVNPSVRWISINNIVDSRLDYVLLGGSLPYFGFYQSDISYSTLFFYLNFRNSAKQLDSKLIFSSCTMLNMSIFNRAITRDVIFNNIIPINLIFKFTNKIFT